MIACGLCSGRTGYDSAVISLRLLMVALAVAMALSGCRSDSPSRPVEAVIPRPAPTPAAIPLLAALSAAAPEADPAVLALALRARSCAIDAAMTTRLAVIDYSRPSTQQRLWVFDLRQPRLLYSEYVAHGRNSGENFATQFSNRRRQPAVESRPVPHRGDL